MNLRRCIGPNGEDYSYIEYPKAIPSCLPSEDITDVYFDQVRYHCGEGDMWPLTWAEDDNMYGAAGDNKGVSMNLWKITTRNEDKNELNYNKLTNTGDWTLDLWNSEPLNYKQYTLSADATGVKPASLLDIGGKLYFAVEIHHYGDNPIFNRQKNLHGWIITSDDFGLTWDKTATPTNFFTGRLASCHFIQYGRGYTDARDDYVYAYFPYDEDGSSYWENNDGLLLGRVPKDRILCKENWEFYKGLKNNHPQWSLKEQDAIPVFEYIKMTGENHVSYNRGLGRYIMGNYGFIDKELYPRPVHQMKWPLSHISQLTLYEAKEPWGPWKIFYRNDNWGTYGDYQPNFPTKWMSKDGHMLCMVSSGSWDDYNFVVQKLALRCKGELTFPNDAHYFGLLDSD